MKILKSASSVLALYFLTSAGAVSALGDVIGVNWDTGVFYNVSTTNAAVAVLATPGIAHLAEIERAPDGTLYGFTTSGPAPVLYRFDSTTYAPTFIGQLTTRFVAEGGLAFSPGGIAYGTEVALANEGTGLFTINLATGAATIIGPISGGPLDINGLAYRSDGLLVALDRVTNSLLLINPMTAVSSILAPISAVVGGVGGMTVSGGVGYFSTSGPGGSAPGSNELYTFDLFTGQQTLIGSFGPTVSGAGISGLAAFPTPESSSSALLLSLGLIGIWIECFRFRRPRLGTSQTAEGAGGVSLL